MGGTANLFMAGNSLISGVAQADAARIQGEAQQAAFEMNARLAELQAEQIRDTGDIASSRARRKANLAVSAQRAKAAASGQSAAQADLIKESAFIGELDALTIKNNAYRQAYGHDLKAVNDKHSAALAKAGSEFKARSSLIVGGLNAVGFTAKAYEKSDGFRNFFKRKPANVGADRKMIMRPVSPNRGTDVFGFKFDSIFD